MRLLENKQLIALLETLGHPVAYHSFKNSTELPFIVVYEDAPRNKGADNIVYLSRKRRMIEVYSKYKDFDLEEKIEKLLNDNKIYWTKSPDMRTEEDIVEVVYYI